MKRLQLLAYSWAIRCFGIEHVHNREVRILRLLEEVAEVGQAADIPREQFDKVLDIVYSRPKGEFHQEMGGVAMTYAVLCEAEHMQIPDILMVELNKVCSKPTEYYAARNAEKVQARNG